MSRVGTTTYPSMHERTSQNPETHSTPRAWGMELQSKLDFVEVTTKRKVGVDSTQLLLLKEEKDTRGERERKEGKKNKKKKHARNVVRSTPTAAI